MKTFLLFLTLAFMAAAQQFTPVVYAGSGYTQGLANGYGSNSAIAGASISTSFKGGVFIRTSVSMSRVRPLGINPSPAFLSPQFLAWPGYRLKHGTSRWALLAGPTFARNRFGDFIPGVGGGFIFRISKRWSPLVCVNRSLPIAERRSQTWSISSTMGFSLNSFKLPGRK